MDNNLTVTRQTKTYAEPIYEKISPDTQILLNFADALVADDEPVIAELSKQVLFAAESLMAMKSVMGADFIREKGYRTDLADERYGNGWLNR